MRIVQPVLLVLFLAVYGMSMPVPDTTLTQGDIRVLVVLVEFSDVKFKSVDPKSQYNDYLNKEGYDEFHNVGSVRDYFVYNSMGKFRPTFDVYGPVTLPEVRSYYGGHDQKDSAGLALSLALNALLERGESFSGYDANGDGIVDYVAMICAGGEAEYLLGEKKMIHTVAAFPEERFWKMVGGNLRVGPYICTNEIGTTEYGESTGVLDGIGLFVHEFSHLMGLPDLYMQGSMLKNIWSVMNYGVYNCPSNSDGVQGCAPPLYSTFERMSLGWLTPKEINADGLVRLDKLDDNVAYSITNPENPDEVYFLEYRTNKGWDVGQQTSGMLIWHVNYEGVAWIGNVHHNVNVVGAAEQYSIVMRSETNGVILDRESSPYDPFPGKGEVTEFNKFIFNNGLDLNITLSDITESPDKDFVTFKVTMGTPFKTELSSSSYDECELGIKLCISSSSGTYVNPLDNSVIVYPKSESSVVPFAEEQPQVSVVSQNGMVSVSVPMAGRKSVRMFSLNGQLLFETTMEGSDYRFQWPRHLGLQKVILSITQGNANLFTGMIGNH